MLDLLLGAVVSVAADPRYGEPELLLRFADPRISESSGLVASSRQDGVLFTHNDSGDDARFFAVDPTGRTLRTYALPGVRARDWEGIARGPDARGRSCLWLGDIGDNNAARDNGILVHRVLEPTVPAGGSAAGDRAAGGAVETEPPTSFRLRYPDGPGDAEVLLVHPRTGRLYVVSKPLAGPATMYAAPSRLDPSGPNALERVGSVRVQATGTGGGPGIGGLAQLLVTGGDIAPDGSRLAIRTYTDAYEWLLPTDDVGAALSAAPIVTALPETEQGEGLAYSRDSRSLLTSSEGRSAPVHRLTAVDRPDVGTAPSAAPAAPPAAAPPAGEQRRTDVWWWLSGGVLALVGLLVARRRRRLSRE